MYKRLSSILTQFKGKKIAVWGDYILDEYVYTSTGRVSREAPVLVAEFEGNTFKLGGAGNVALNLLSLGATPIPLGLVGNDEQGRRMLELLQVSGIDARAMIVEPTYKTAHKSRIMAGGEHTRKQQVLRIDAIHKGSVTQAAYDRLQQQLSEAMRTCAGLVISDYLFHAVAPQILAALRASLPHLFVAIDSRCHLLDFRTMTLATPNEPELKNLFPRDNFTDNNDFIRAGWALLDQIAASGLILKRGQEGMMVFERGQDALLIPIYGSAAIVDVTGAGDTVLAAAAAALLSGATLAEAARLANIAGGLVVMQEGNYPLPQPELSHAIQQIQDA